MRDPPLSKAFIFCGWETISVDWVLDRAMTYQTTSGSNLCTTNFNRFALLQLLWTALQRAEPGKSLVTSGMAGHHPDR